MNIDLKGADPKLLEAHRLRISEKYYSREHEDKAAKVNGSSQRTDITVYNVKTKPITLQNLEKSLFLKLPQEIRLAICLELATDDAGFVQRIRAAQILDIMPSRIPQIALLNICRTIYNEAHNDVFKNLNMITPSEHILLFAEFTGNNSASSTSKVNPASLLFDLSTKHFHLSTGQLITRLTILPKSYIRFSRLRESFPSLRTITEVSYVSSDYNVTVPKYDEPAEALRWMCNMSVPYLDVLVRRNAGIYYLQSKGGEHDPFNQRSSFAAPPSETDYEVKFDGENHESMDDVTLEQLLLLKDLTLIVQLKGQGGPSITVKPVIIFHDSDELVTWTQLWNIAHGETQRER
ncbi:hypothetical protein BT63DRAFT_460399 [Microthyrium microscopicum]|uniref:F-box domain-containing protein n=1 Tax=Microthyrium microscopicum TaxID=703497 RepID=A0A6A6TZ11_9PEZI|nr:hypothetical protein BT63DRAFT_460399 [Microthyrium microscopicum]